MARRNGWMETVSAFAVGVGIGAAIGVLFAPKAGEETRDDLADNAKDGVDQVVSRGREWAGRAQKATSEAVNQAKSQVRDAIDAGEQAYREAKNSLS
jgi:gas vesicle protein